MHRVSICCNPHHYRDIAARNVRLSAQNIAKVANVEFAVKKGNIQKPMTLSIKWTAPEAIKSRVRTYPESHAYYVYLSTLLGEIWSVY